MNKILVIRTCGDNEGVLEDADFALIELDKVLIDSIQARMKLVKQIKTADESFVQADFIEWSPQFISQATLEKTGLKRAKQDNWDDCLWEIVPTTRGIEEMLKDSETERMSSVHLTVSEDSFFWGAYPKYANMELTTDRIYQKKLDEIAKLI